MLFTFYKQTDNVISNTTDTLGSALIEFTNIVEQMRLKGARKILIKALANNDNSKNQIYLGSDFEVIRVIPSGNVYADGISKKGPIFKAPLDFYWITPRGETQKAPHAQIILYPKYPETRMSGFMRGCDRNIAPSHLMQPPTREQRAQRQGLNRYLILGINDSSIWAFCTSWNDDIQREVKSLIESDKTELIATVFHEYKADQKSSEEKLLQRLKEIYAMGPIESCRLNSSGELLPYKAQNGAGYTLEAQFGITPNGSPDPDFMDWEIKSHSAGAVTLMTPEPNTGTYLDNLEVFLRQYGTRIQPERLDFASRHDVGKQNVKTKLTMRLEGYDPNTGKVTDPEGGLMLRGPRGELAAGWKFEKIIQHWKNKHSNTCFVSYSTTKGDKNYYQYGPKVILGKGTSLDKLLDALYKSIIYYDPGINMKLIDGKWKPKKRNQFRVSWTNLPSLYVMMVEHDLSGI